MTGPPAEKIMEPRSRRADTENPYVEALKIASIESIVKSHFVVFNFLRKF